MPAAEVSCLVRPHLRFLAFSSRLETRDSRLVCHASHVSRYWSILLLQLLDPDSALQPSDHWRWSGRHASGGQAGPCTCTVLCKVVTRFLRRDSLASNLQLVPEAGNGAALPPDCGQKETLFLILALPQNDGNKMHRLPPTTTSSRTAPCVLGDRGGHTVCATNHWCRPWQSRTLASVNRESESHHSKG